MHIYESERKVMDLLWKHGTLSARELSDHLLASAAWKRTTTYTVIKKCIDKGYIKREDPGFICAPIITLEDSRRLELEEFVRTVYRDDVSCLISDMRQKGYLD